MYTPLLRSAFRAALRERRWWPHAALSGILIGTGVGSALLQAYGTSPALAGALRGVLPTRRGVGVLSDAGALWTQASTTGLGAQIALVVFWVFWVTLLCAILLLAVASVNTLVLHAAGRGASRTRFAAGRRRVWTAAGVHLILRIAIIAILIIWTIVLGRAATAAATGALVTGAIGFIITVLILSAIHCATPYAVCAVVLDGHGVRAALREAFALLRDRLAVTVEYSLLLTVASIAALLLWIAGSIVLAAPFALLVGIGVASKNVALVTPAIAAGLIALIAYLTVLAMIYGTFLVTAWTALYLRLTSSGEPLTAWIQRRSR